VFEGDHRGVIRDPAGHSAVLNAREGRSNHCWLGRVADSRLAAAQLTGGLPWAAQGLANTLENLTGGMEFVIVRIDVAVSSIENYGPMTGSRTPDVSSGISSLHCLPGISGSWFHSSLVAAPMTVVLVNSKRLVLTTGIGPPAMPMTSNRRSRASECKNSVNRSQPTGSTITSTRRCRTCATCSVASRSAGTASSAPWSTGCQIRPHHQRYRHMRATRPSAR
jgi:hypothetical protein